MATFATPQAHPAPRISSTETKCRSYTDRLQKLRLGSFHLYEQR
jgi:hypothetical protein